MCAPCTMQTHHVTSHTRRIVYQLVCACALALVSAAENGWAGGHDQKAGTKPTTPTTTAAGIRSVLILFHLRTPPYSAIPPWYICYIHRTDLDTATQWARHTEVAGAAFCEISCCVLKKHPRMPKQRINPKTKYRNSRQEKNRHSVIAKHTDIPRIWTITSATQNTWNLF